MTFISTGYEHVVVQDDQTPIIAGTTMKVIELVVEKEAYGWSPEELQFQHPYLTLGQIYSALAYYADHTAELNHEIEQRLKKVSLAQAQSGHSSLRERLKARGLIE